MLAYELWTKDKRFLCSRLTRTQIERALEEFSPRWPQGLEILVVVMGEKE